MKYCPGGSFWDGYSTDVWGSIGQMSAVKNFRQALKSLEKQHVGADIYGPNVWNPGGPKTLPSQKLQAVFSFPGK